MVEPPSRNGGQLLQIYERLRRFFGPQHWWPAQTPTEVVIGAILTQNTAWRNVEKAINNLRGRGALDWIVLRAIAVQELEQLIQPAGTYRVKANRLKSFVDHLWREHEGSLDSLLSGKVEVARKRLMAIPGIGPETADAILLYAGGKTTFVVDAYTKRILRRHYFISPGASYEQVRALFQTDLPSNATLYNEFHALLVALGKQFCKTAARCKGCPLANLPHDEML